jgi:hypothetical protein
VISLEPVSNGSFLLKKKLTDCEFLTALEPRVGSSMQQFVSQFMAFGLYGFCDGSSQVNLV